MIETDVHPDGRTDARSDAEQCVADYIELLASHLGGQRDFDRLRWEGRFWAPQTLPLAYSYGQYGDCFRNATQLAFCHRLHYCEGYAFHGIIVTHHAWCVDERGRVVDRVWRIKPRGRLYAVDGSDVAYFGIRFSADELHRSVLATGTCGLLFRGLI